MYVIANNISTRKKEVADIFATARDGDWQDPGAVSRLRMLTEKCVTAGADALEIDLQQRYEKPEAIEFAVNTVQSATRKQICISARDIDVLEAGLKMCRIPPIVNYVSLHEECYADKLQLAGRYGAEVVLLVSQAMNPSDSRAMLNDAAVLIEAAGRAGIPSQSLLIDPGLIHIRYDIGQQHLLEAVEFLKTLPEIARPPVRNTCWLGNASAGIPSSLKPAVETSLLSLLRGVGLQTVFSDVLGIDIMRSVRLLKVFTGQTVYSDAYIQGNHKQLE